jgi:hypothetical protein
VDDLDGEYCIIVSKGPQKTYIMDKFHNGKIYILKEFSSPQTNLKFLINTSKHPPHSELVNSSGRIKGSKELR